MYAFALLFVFSLQTNDTLSTANSYGDSLSVDHVLEIKKLDLEREKLALDKRRFEKSDTFINRNSGVIITGLITLMVALITRWVNNNQLKIANIAKERELDLTNQHNQNELEISDRQKRSELEQAYWQKEVEEERLWRSALLDFLEKHHNELLSSDPLEKEQTQTMLNIAFPARFAKKTIQRYDLITSPSANIGRKSVRKKVFEVLLMPLIANFDKTHKAFTKYFDDPKAEDDLLSGNRGNLDILSENMELIPTNFKNDALKLVEHYNAWLEEYNRIRLGNDSDKPESRFVFAGPNGFPYPKDAERKFRELHKLYADELGISV